MAIPERVKTKMKEEGLTKVNVPKRTPNHKTKSHCVMAKEGDTYKFIRFGQQGVSPVLGRILHPQRIRHVRNPTMHVIMHRGNRPASCQRSIGHIKLNGKLGDIPMAGRNNPRTSGTKRTGGDTAGSIIGNLLLFAVPGVGLIRVAMTAKRAIQAIRAMKGAKKIANPTAAQIKNAKPPSALPKPKSGGTTQLTSKPKGDVISQVQLEK